MNYKNGQHINILEVISLCNEITSIIDIKPEIIIGIAEGGIMPAKILADKYDCCVDYLPIKRKYSKLKHNIVIRYLAKHLDKYYQKLYSIRKLTEILNKNKERTVPTEINSNLFNSTTKILIVDDFASSGNTIEQCKRYLIKSGADDINIKSAVLIYDKYKIDEKYLPNYFLSNDVWLCFPWSSNSPYYNDYLNWKTNNKVI